MFSETKVSVSSVVFISVDDVILLQAVMIVKHPSCDPIRAGDRVYGEGLLQGFHLLRIHSGNIRDFSPILQWQARHQCFQMRFVHERSNLWSCRGVEIVLPGFVGIEHHEHELVVRDAAVSWDFAAEAGT